MIAYTTVGTNDLPRAMAFYDSLLAALGVQRVMQFRHGVGWGHSLDTPVFGVVTPHDGQSASVGNGSMVCLRCTDNAQVHALYDLALSLGAKDEGTPGSRGDGYYGAYFRDLDGNKLAVFCITAS
jgi:catechol 2,3-dioxygenase-like lactoylglutathione lyase family enzyme